MYLRFKEEYEGCKVGDTVRFENEVEALALIDAGKAEEVAVRQTITIEDSAGGQS
jgi:hypothetical protein